MTGNAGVSCDFTMTEEIFCFKELGALLNILSYIGLSPHLGTLFCLNVGTRSMFIENANIKINKFLYLLI